MATSRKCQVRQSLPPWQTNYTSDDYVEYTWHAPTSRLYIGRAMLRPKMYLVLYRQLRNPSTRPIVIAAFQEAARKLFRR